MKILNLGQGRVVLIHIKTIYTKVIVINAQGTPIRQYDNGLKTDVAVLNCKYPGGLI